MTVAASTSSGGAGRSARPAPPVTITGVAPWATSAAGSSSSAGSGRAQPPVTITGVAPWAQPAGAGSGGPGAPRAGLRAGPMNLGGPVRAGALLPSGGAVGVSHEELSGSGSRGQPPVTITGVAPWAAGAGAGAAASSSSSSGSRAQPPVTVTGVAPWAMGAGGGGASIGMGVPRPGAAAAAARGFAPRMTAALAPEEEGDADDSSAAVLHPAPEDRIGYSAISGGIHAGAAAAGTGTDTLSAFLEQLSPAPSRGAIKGSSSSGGGAGCTAGSASTASSGEGGAGLDPSFRGGVTDLSGETVGAAGAAAMHADVLSPSPTLLPSLAFHDLVFGHELGSGSFSTVRFAKQIVRGALGSTWPQYAVKVISTSTMASLGYEASVRREIAALAVLTHPSITRLVSAFRWRDGAYLVLEFAPKGDLHGAMSSLGSLAEAAARFLGGEILAALMAVHAAGFAFADCKPENVLLVEDGRGGTHAKLTDFGAARPISGAGRALVARSRRILQDMRDGDWRAKQGLSVSVRDTGAAAAGTIADSTSAAAAAAATGGAGGSSASIAAVKGGSSSAAMAEDVTAGASGASASASPAATAGVEVADEAEDQDEEDSRLEGTEEYLAPELASGTGRPSIASDAYAFGVTLFQLLTGQMPDADAIWAEQQAAAATAVAAIDAAAGAAAAGSGSVAGATGDKASGPAASASHRHVRFTGPREPPFPPGFPDGAVALIRGLLHPDPALRLGGGPRGLADVAEHPWFAPVLALGPSSAPGLTAPPHSIEGVSGEGHVHPGVAALSSPAAQSLLRLHAATGPKIAAGKAAPASADSAWSRRHNSTIWAPLPRSYLQNDDGTTASGSNLAGARARRASDLSVRDMLQLASLPALPPHIHLED